MYPWHHLTSAIATSLSLRHCHALTFQPFNFQPCSLSAGLSLKCCNLVWWAYLWCNNLSDSCIKSIFCAKPEVIQIQLLAVGGCHQDKEKLIPGKFLLGNMPTHCCASMMQRQIFRCDVFDFESICLILPAQFRRH